MGQVLHRGATTTEAIRRAIQRSQESLRALAHRHGINPKTVAKWRKRCSVIADLSVAREGRRIGVFTGVGAHPERALLQCHGQNRTGNPLLHHPPQAGCGAAEPLHSSALGHRKQLHWMLDVGFGEDLARKRAGHAAQNFSLLNRIALKLLQQYKSSKRGE